MSHRIQPDAVSIEAIDHVGGGTIRVMFYIKRMIK